MNETDYNYGGSGSKDYNYGGSGSKDYNYGSNQASEYRYETENKEKDNNAEKKQTLIFSFMLPFLQFSVVGSQYFDRYRFFTKHLENIFKERVFTNSSPITGITETGIDKFLFAEIRAYTNNAVTILLFSAILAIATLLMSHMFFVSIIFLSMYVWVVFVSMYYDINYVSSHYTFYAKKFSHEGITISKKYYDNYISVYKTTISMFWSNAFVGLVIFLVMVMFKDSLEYILVYDSGITKSLTFYLFALSIVAQFTYLIYLNFKIKKIEANADIEREKLIKEILNVTKTNFEIAKEKLRRYE